MAVPSLVEAGIRLRKNVSRTENEQISSSLGPRKSVGLTWGNKSVYTELVPTFRNFDFSVGRMSTYQLIK